MRKKLKKYFNKNTCFFSIALAMSVISGACSSPRKTPSKNNFKNYMESRMAEEESSSESSKDEISPSEAGSERKNAADSEQTKEKNVEGTSEGTSVQASDTEGDDSKRQNTKSMEAESKTSDGQGSAANEVKQDTAQAQKGSENSKSTAESKKQQQPETPANKVDYDLTQMGADMIYASVYQLMVEPEKFEGKTFKMVGTYYSTWYEPTARNYHYIIIEDAAACCAQGIEFVWGDGSHVFPDEYPKGNVRLEVTGTFITYKEPGDDRLYCRLDNATIKQID